MDGCTTLLLEPFWWWGWEYEKQFHQPETFLKLGNRLLVIPVPDDAVKSAENKVVIKPPAEHDR